MPLTDTAIKKAKPGPRPVKLSDGKGMYLLVTDSGSKPGRWKYRADGKEKVALKLYPDVTLAQAREAAARKLLAAGNDPMVRKADKLAKQSAAENSFQTVALLWWEQWRGAKSPRHADDVIKRLQTFSRHLENGLCLRYKPPNWWRWSRPLRTRRAGHCQTCPPDIRQVSRYGIAHGLAQRNPWADIKPE